MKNHLGVGLIFLLLLPCAALADVGPPAHIQITERQAKLYSVQWRVPKVLPPRAVPTPQLPDTCRPLGQRVVSDQQGAWLLTREWRCEIDLAGQLLGVLYPFPELALTTIVRVELLSGDRFAHVLSPGDGPWRLPVGTAAPDFVRAAQRAVAGGATHIFSAWIHLVFLLVLALLGGFRQSFLLVSAWTLGQIAGVMVSALVTGIGAAPAEIGVAIGVALLARQTLQPVPERRRLPALSATAGLAHGLGILALLGGDPGDRNTGLFDQLCAVLGMDAALLIGAAGLAALMNIITRRQPMLHVRQAAAYIASAVSVALALSLAVRGEVAEKSPVGSSLQMPANPAANPISGRLRSQRVAPAAPNADVQSFLAIEPFEVRHEVMLRLAGLADELGLKAESTLEIDAQPAVSKRLADLVLASIILRTDGESPEGQLRRVDFMTVDPTGALPRTKPMPEAVADAAVGVVIVYPTAGMPQRVSFGWERFPTSIQSVAATLIDPEAVTSQILTVAEPTLVWENKLTEDPIPTVTAIEVEPVMIPLPWLSLPLLAIFVFLFVTGISGRRPVLSLAAARIILACAALAGPLAQTAVALPGSAGQLPSERQARRILAGILPNIYRAMEFRDEATIYDRLAVSVTGDTLTEVYLQQRRALEVEERGGAQARVEAVEILEAADVESRQLGFGVRSAWTVSGMVSHFGHRHFRQNQYNAWIEIVPVEGEWKITSIEIFEQERLK